MDKQTPTQIASEIMEGCSRKLEQAPFVEVPEKCGESQWVEYHYEDGDHTHRDDQYIKYLCSLCKSKILAYRTAWENELEFLIKLCKEDVDDCSDLVNDRISELTSALKILETK